MIITFYSYKGGVGRTQLAANLAAYLYLHKHRKILLIDWDLEAPGIDVFFDLHRDKVKKGLIDLLLEFVDGAKNNKFSSKEDLPPLTNDFITNIWPEDKKGAKLDLISASKFDSQYSSKINNFNWHEFYETLQGKYYIEHLKNSIKDPKSYDLEIDKYDYVLIDSRTGESDYSGICNIQFPDVNIIVSAPTMQNFNGCVSVIKNIIDSPYVENELREPIIMPILSRIVEGDNTDTGIWTAKFRDTFYDPIKAFIYFAIKEKNIENDLLENVVDEYIDATCLPHKNELAYGENLVFDENRIKPEKGQIQMQYIEIARFIEDFKQYSTETHTQKFKGSGDNVAGDKILLEYSRKLPKFLTSIPSNPYYLIGRKNELYNIHLFLQETESVSIMGPGGIGKTTLALAYAHKFGRYYDHIIWLKGKGKRNILASSRELFEILNIPADKFNLSSKKAEVLVKIKLSQIGKKNLLIVDDYEGKDIYRPNNWTVLTTSRGESFGATFFLAALSFKDSLDLFYDHYKVEKNNPIISDVLTLIDFHVLGIEIIAKAAQFAQLKPAELYNLIQNGFLKSKLAQTVKVKTNDNKYVSFADSLSQIVEFKNLGEVEMKILQRLSILPSLYFDREVLFTLLDLQEIEFLAFPRSLKVLVSKGFLIETENQIKCYLLIKEIIRKEIPATVENSYPTLEKLLQFSTSTSPDAKNLAFIPYLESVIDYFKNRPEGIFTNLMSNLATLYHVAGNMHKAIELFQVVLSRDLEEYGKDHPLTVIDKSNLALVYQGLGEFTTAKDLLEESVQSIEKTQGANSEEVIRVKLGLAIVYMELSEFDQSASILENIIGVIQRSENNEDPLLSECESHLAMVYHSQGKHTKAKELLEIAYKKTIEKLGRDHANTINIQSNLALVYQTLGDFSAALSLLEDALQNNITTYGENHISVGVRKSNLAMVYRDLGEHLKAKEMLQATLSTLMKYYEEEHPSIARIQARLASVFQSLNAYKLAEEFQQKALKSTLKHFGEQHLETALNQTNLAGILIDQGEYTIAEELQVKALNNVINQKGPFSLSAGGYNNMARISAGLGDRLLAIDSAHKSYEILRENLGPNHPNTIACLRNLNIYRQRQSK